MHKLFLINTKPLHCRGFVFYSNFKIILLAIKRFYLKKGHN